MLQSYYKNVVRQDLLTKYHYQNFFQLGSLEKIVLSFSTSQSSLKDLLPLLSALYFISLQKPFLLKSKRMKVTLRLKHGSPIGCKVDLRGKEKYVFLEKLIFSILPQLRDFTGFDPLKQSFSLKIDNLFSFRELEKDYEHFSDLPSLNVNFVLKTSHLHEKIGLLSLLKLPFKQK